MTEVQMNNYYEKHRQQMENYKNSSIPRPSEKMDSYFPPYSVFAQQQQHHQPLYQPSNRTIPAAKFRSTRKQPEQMEVFNMFDKDHHHHHHQSESNLQRFSEKYEQHSQQPPSLQVNGLGASMSSQFSDDESSSEEEDDEGDDEEEEEEHDDETLVEEASSTSSASSSSSSSSSNMIRAAPFTPPKPDNEIVIEAVAHLMRSSSERQRRRAVHFINNNKNERYQLNSQVSSDNEQQQEEERRGRQMNSHWLHNEENDENSLPMDHFHVGAKEDEVRNDIYRIFKDLNGSRKKRQPIPTDFHRSSRGGHQKSESVQADHHRHHTSKHIRYLSHQEEDF